MGKTMVIYVVFLSDVARQKLLVGQRFTESFTK